MGSIRFSKLSKKPAPQKPNAESPLLDFFERLHESVTERFARATGLTVVTGPIDLPGTRQTDDPPPRLIHPLCEQCSQPEICQVHWDAHLAELTRQPEVHWHRCPQDQLCAIAPIVHATRCLAICRLVCPPAMDDQTFERHVELLDLLVDNFILEQKDLLNELAPSHPTQPAENRSNHRLVTRAIEYIKQNLTDPNMTVADIARRLETNSTYLANLFSRQIGIRMSRYIANQRIELAKNLLATTDDQIKQIAYKTGHANADWFSQAFRIHTGQSPRDYRRNTRKS